MRNIAPRPAYRFTDAELNTLLGVLPVMEAWIQAVRAEATARLLRNAASLPEWKLVNSDTRRRWYDDKQVRHVCAKLKIDTDAYAPRTLLSPLQLEKLFRRLRLDPTQLAAYMVRNPPAPVLAPVSSPGEPFQPPSSPAADFALD